MRVKKVIATAIVFTLVFALILPVQAANADVSAVENNQRHNDNVVHTAEVAEISEHNLGDDYPAVEAVESFFAEPTLEIMSTASLMVSAGGSHSVVIKPDGTLWAWGSNWTGQLGDGTTTNRHSPVRIGTASNWSSVSAGGSHILGIRTDGTLWAWGNNDYAQLGDGTTTRRHSPVRIGTATNWASVSANTNHSVGIRVDGTLWAWGGNFHGQLGDGTTTNRHSPVRIGTATNWANVSAAQWHTVAIRADGTLWAWGAMRVVDWVTVQQQIDIFLFESAQQQTGQVLRLELDIH